MVNKNPIVIIETFSGDPKQVEQAYQQVKFVEQITSRTDLILPPKLLTLGILCGGNYQYQKQNEYRDLYECLKRNSEIADEIIIVTNNSNKHNKDVLFRIAQHFGSRFIEYETDSFSEMRNRVILNGKGEFILMLDCDEDLNGVIPQFRRVLENLRPENLGIFMDIENIYVNDGIQESKFEIYLRSFRRNENILYKGAVHEDILPSILNHSVDPNSLITLSEVMNVQNNMKPFWIKHYGYATPENRHIKSIRNLQLLNKYIIDDPIPGYFLFRALEHFTLGNLVMAEKDIAFGLLLLDMEEHYNLKHIKIQLLTLGSWISSQLYLLLREDEYYKQTFVRAKASLEEISIMKTPKLAVAMCAADKKDWATAFHMYEKIIQEEKIPTSEFITIDMERIRRAYQACSDNLINERIHSLRG